VFHKAKLKSSSEIVKSPVPAQVLDRSYLSVSFLVDMLLDKCLYSIPLYRQHQRLKLDGFHLSRGTLTSNFINVCSALSRIVDAQLFSVMLSRILAKEGRLDGVLDDILLNALNSDLLSPFS